MPENDDPQNGDEQSFETQQGTAGFAQRPAPPDLFGAAADVFELPREMTPEELDARQASIGLERRSGPPLPEGEDTTAGGSLGLATGDDLSRQVEPTEVREPSED